MNDFMRIDLSNFDNRKEEISRDLMKAASEHGFFYGKSIDIF
jgi:isopenicillin N synthase-like dioxygenase